MYSSKTQLKSHFASICEYTEMYGAFRHATYKYYRDRWFRPEHRRPALALITRIAPVKSAAPSVPSKPKMILIKKAA